MADVELDAEAQQMRVGIDIEARGAKRKRARAERHVIVFGEQDHVLAVQSLEQHNLTLATQTTQITLLQQQVTNGVLAKNSFVTKLTKAQEEKGNTLAQLEILQKTYNSLDKSLALVKSVESLVAAKQSIQVAMEATQATIVSMDANVNSIAAELEGQSKLLESQTSQLASAQQTRLVQVQLVEQVKKSVAEKAELVQQSIEACSVAMQSVVEERQRSVHLAPLRALSPEQLCLSVLQSTDVLKIHIAAEAAELEKQTPLAADATTQQRSARTLQATRQALDKLRSHIDVFANLYSSGVGQTSDEFFASPDQALYMANGGSVFQWSAPNSNNVTGQVVQQADPAVASTLLFRSLLSREPTSEEERWISELLSKAGDKKPAVAQELVWSLLTSSEFRVYP